MKFDKFLLVAIIYFFFNSLLLPMGLMYTVLLTPLFYYWLLKNNRKNILGYFIAAWAPWAIVHFFVGGDVFFYIKSSLLYFTVYIFCYAFYIFLKRGQRLKNIFGYLLVFNFIGVLIAFLILFTPINKLLWTFAALTVNMTDFPRIRLLTYEPSYYATLMVPFVVYYTLGILLKPYSLKTIIGLLVMITLPLAFSFSLGVLACLFISFVLILLLKFRLLINKRRVFYSLTALIITSILGLIAVAIFLPDNPLFERINDLYSGKDTSAQGRTTQAFVLANQIAEISSYWFGAGIGQIKIMGNDIIREFYDLDYVEASTIRIPNTIGETIATFGYVGLSIRIGLEIYLFYKTKVWTNLYRLTLFIYIFVYQFTGSFLTNIAEYVIWILAFTPYFSFFDIKNFKASKILINQKTLKPEAL